MTEFPVVVGVKNDPQKASYYVPAYLIGAGYKVYLVNPDESGEILGLPVYDRVQDVPEHIDIVDIFRRPNVVPRFLPRTATPSSTTYIA